MITHPATKVSDWCWLGDWKDASRFRQGVPGGKVITVAYDSPFVGDYVFPVVDGYFQGNDRQFFRAVDQILLLRDLKPRPMIMINSVNGVSRGPAALIAAGMKLRHISYPQAYAEIKKLRPQINPHPYFVNLLSPKPYQLPTPVRRL